MYCSASPTRGVPSSDDDMAPPRTPNPLAGTGIPSPCFKRKQALASCRAEEMPSPISVDDAAYPRRHDTPPSSSSSGLRHADDDAESEPAARPAKRQRLDFGADQQSFLQAILNSSDDAGEPASQSRKPTPYATASPAHEPCLSEAFSDTGSLTWGEHGLPYHQLFAAKQPASPPPMEECWGLPPVYPQLPPHQYSHHPHHHPSLQTPPPHYAAAACRQHMGSSPYMPYCGASNSRMPTLNPPSFYNPRASFYASEAPYSPVDVGDSAESGAYCCPQLLPPASSSPCVRPLPPAIPRTSQEAEFLENLDEDNITEAETQRNLKKLTACLTKIPGLEKIRWQSILLGTRSPEVGDRETQRRVKEAETIGTRLFGGDANKLFTSLLNQNADFLVSYVASLRNGKKKHRKLRARLLRELSENGSEESSDS